MSLRYIFLCMQSNYIHNENMSREHLTYYNSSSSSSKSLNYTNHFPNLTLIVSTPINKIWQPEFTKLRGSFWIYTIFSISNQNSLHCSLTAYPLKTRYGLSHFCQVSIVLIHEYRKLGAFWKDWKEAYTLVFLLISFIFLYNNCFYLNASVEIVQIFYW